MRYECILRYGVNSGHEYRFAVTRRVNGAVAECERMVATTHENMTDHANGGRVAQGAHPTDPNATVVALMLTDGRVSYKTVTFRPADRPSTPDDGLEDALLASVLAYCGGSI